MPYEEVELSRDVEAVMIPQGVTTLLKAGIQAVFPHRVQGFQRLMQDVAGQQGKGRLALKIPSPSAFFGKRFCWFDRRPQHHR